MFPPCFFLSALASDVTEGDDKRITPAAAGMDENLGFIETVQTAALKQTKRRPEQTTFCLFEISILAKARLIYSGAKYPAGV